MDGYLSPTNSNGLPFNPVLTTTVICDVGSPGPKSDYFVGFLYNNTRGESFIITAKHCIPDADYIYPRFRDVSDPRAVPAKRVPLWDSENPRWREHPFADVAAVPLEVELPAYPDEITYDGTWPNHNLVENYPENSTVHHEVYASAFTEDHLPDGQHTEGDRVPFAGDDVSVICYDKTKSPDAPYNSDDPPSNEPFPKVRHLTISTPYRFDYDGKPAFLNDGRLFQGSSGAPVLYIPPTRMFSWDVEARRMIDRPALIGVHGSVVERTVDGKQLNLYKAVRAEEITPLTDTHIYDWDVAPEM
jgi:hypothetical protein